MSKGQLALWGGITAVVFVVGVVIYKYAWTRNSSSGALNKLSALEAYLKAPDNGAWHLARPPRDDWKPGMILEEESGTYSIAMSDTDFCPESSYPRSHGNAAFAALEVNLDSADDASAKFLAGRESAKLTAAGNEKVKCVAQGLHITGIPIAKLKEALRSHPNIEKSLSDPNSTYWLITEVLIADKLTYSDEVSAAATATAKVQPTDAIKAAYAGKSGVVSTGILETTLPMVIGYHCKRINDLTNAQGGPGELSLIDPDESSWEDGEGLGRLVPAPPNNLHSKLHVHVLSIGLDRYVSIQGGRVGGELPGSPWAAFLVAQRFEQVTKDDEYSSVTLFAPAIAGRFNRTRTSKSDLTKRIDSWIREEDDHISRRRSGGNDLPDFFIVYFSGHGLASSLTRIVELLPEDFVEAPGFRGSPPAEHILAVNEIDQALKGKASLILVDCCREEDHDLKEAADRSTQPFRNGLEVGALYQMRNSSLAAITSSIVIYAVTSDTLAMTHPYLINGTSHAIGPVAISVDKTFAECNESPHLITTGEFIGDLLHGRMLDGKTLQIFMGFNQPASFRPQRPKWASWPLFDRRV